MSDNAKETMLSDLRECRAALDDLIQKKPGIEALFCGTNTIGNLRAELGKYKREEINHER